MTEKQEYHADCYVLTEKRTSAFILSFLDTFLPYREESADEYEVPQYSKEPKIVFKTADELINYLTQNKEEIHTVYWRNKDKTDIKGAMCFFTDNGQLILGIYCDTLDSDTRIEDKVFADLKAFCGNSIGYITYEEPATHNTTEFMERVKCANA